MSEQNASRNITPDTKLSFLLEHYPQLEEPLIEMAPALSKIKNPVLRKTVINVTTLRQVANLATISLSDLINELRKQAGIKAVYCEGEEQSVPDSQAPEWLKKGTITRTLDARKMLEEGEHPLGQVMNEIKNFEPGQVYELITPFLPAPLIDKVKEMGFIAWTKTEQPDLIRTYFTPSGN